MQKASKEEKKVKYRYKRADNPTVAWATRRQWKGAFKIPRENYTNFKF